MTNSSLEAGAALYFSVIWPTWPLLILDFQQSFTGYYIPGGFSLGDHVTLMECVTRCNGNRECLAMDYHLDTHTCIAHNHTTACDTFMPALNKKHFKRYLCEDPKVVLADGKFYAEKTEFHVI